MEKESRKSHPKEQEIVEKSNLLMRKKHALDWFREIWKISFAKMQSFEALVRQHIRSGGLASRTQTKQAVFVKTVSRPSHVNK